MGECINLIDVPEVVREEVGAGDHKNIVVAINALAENQRRIAVAAGVVKVEETETPVPPEPAEGE